MTRTSDLLPQASGSASLGVNQRNGTGFDADSIMPYGHVHANSGILHDAANGNSGVLRFASHDDKSYVTGGGPFEEAVGHIAGLQPGFEVSADGGETFPLILGAARLLDLAGEGGGESLMADGGGEDLFAEGGSEGGGIEAVHVGGGSGLFKTAIIRTQNDEMNDLYIYGSGTTSIIGSRKLELMAFGASDGGVFDDAITLDSEKSLSIRAKNKMQIITDYGDLELMACEIGPGTSPLFGSVIAYAFGLNNYLHFRAYGKDSQFGSVSTHQAWHVKNGGIDGAGPYGNGEWPIAHSGQVAAMIAAAGGSAQSLQAAYNGGNEILAVRNVNDRNVGFVVKEQAGKSQLALTQAPSLAHLDYCIAVSGGTGANGFALTKIVPNGVYIKSSGTSTLAESNFVLGYNATNAPQTAFIASTHDLAFFAFRNIAYQAGTAAQQGGQINLSAFLGSGQIEYRYGPFQSWAMKVRNVGTGGPAGDGFHPIPHSGQIDTLILRAIKTKAITIERPAVNQDLTIWYTNEPITITEVESVLRGAIDASGSFSIRYSSDRSLVGTELTTLPISCTSRTTGQITSSFAAPTIPADNWVWIGVSGVSGVATNQLNVTLQYR